MIPTSCGNCQFWDKHPHTKSNWGTCKKVDLAGHSDQACLLNSTVVEQPSYIPTPNVVLYTKDTFFCAEWVYKPPTKQFTIVDAAREAAQRLKERTK